MAHFRPSIFPGIVIWLVVGVWLPHALGIYVPLREYSGQSFFNGWDYYGNIDNTTWGNVTYVDQTTATMQGLTFVDGNGHAIIRVDNTTFIPDTSLVNRNTVKITTKDAYPIGSLILIDAYHIPYGCSVWPSFWTLGAGIEWPHGGEIDVVEAINMLDQNQMALHTDPGCNLIENSVQSGRTIDTDCSLGTGCLVQETKQNSYGSGFSGAGGGVFALQLDVSGIYMWFWSRAGLPASVAGATSTSTFDLADWGTPSAAYPASGCDIAKYFQPQQLIIDITLCGVWAGVPSIYSSTCPNTCISNVIGSGNPVYNTAYWELGYVRTYTAAAATPPGAVNSGSTTTSSAVGSGSVQPIPSSTETSITTTTPFTSSANSNGSPSSIKNVFLNTKMLYILSSFIGILLL